MDCIQRVGLPHNAPVAEIERVWIFDPVDPVVVVADNVDPGDCTEDGGGCAAVIDVVVDAVDAVGVVDDDDDIPIEYCCCNCATNVFIKSTLLRRNLIRVSNYDFIILRVLCNCVTVTCNCFCITSFCCFVRLWLKISCFWFNIKRLADA